jgi:hypothetical protein
MWSVYSDWMEFYRFGQSSVLIWNESSELWEYVVMIRASYDDAVRGSLLVVETMNISITHLINIWPPWECSVLANKSVHIAAYYSVTFLFSWSGLCQKWYTSHTAEFQDKYFTVLLFPCFAKALYQLYGYRALDNEKIWLIMNVELACYS